MRLTLRTANSPVTGSRWSIASLAASISRQSSAPGSGESCGRTRRSGVPSGTSGIVSTCVRSTPRAFQCSIASLASSRSTRPIRSSNRAHAEAAHQLAHLVGDVEEEVDDVLGLALEALAQLGVLRGDPDRARVQVAGAHHDAARRDQRGGREAHLVRAQQRGDDDVAARLDLAVGLHPDARAQVVEHERLLRLGQPDLPRHAGRLDRGQRRRAGAAVVAGDQHVVGVGLRHARRDRARRRPRTRA